MQRTSPDPGARCDIDSVTSAALLQSRALLGEVKAAHPQQELCCLFFLTPTAVHDCEHPDTVRSAKCYIRLYQLRWEASANKGNPTNAVPGLRTFDGRKPRYFRDWRKKLAVVLGVTRRGIASLLKGGGGGREKQTDEGNRRAGNSSSASFGTWDAGHLGPKK